jgi:nicotinate-nucleotide adenylyltransferase
MTSLRIGLMGGTFDPIHNAHLFIAEEARRVFGLHKVLFIPNGAPPHKAGRAVASPEARLEMTRLAIARNAAFEVSDVEISRPGVSYTVDTLKVIHKLHDNATLLYITGIDTAVELMTWKSPDEVMALAEFIAISRPGHSISQLDSALPERYRKRVHTLESAKLNISSTEIRKRVSAGSTIRYLLPDAVLEYIERNNLYR